MKHTSPSPAKRSERAQTLILFMFLLVVLIAMTGISVDLGLAYITKANLAKAADAAALMGARNLYQGDSHTFNIARSTFAMNYGRPAADVGSITPSVTINTDPVSGTRRLQVSASTTINTVFIRVIPAWRTLSVSATAEALRGRLIMGIILDRSGSMQSNGGWSSLPPAVNTFVDYFDDTLDKATLVTYATTVQVDYPMNQPFRSQIKALVPTSYSSYAGATYMTGGLQAGYTQIANTPPFPGENTIKIAVFFTDGLANTTQESVRCPNASSPLQAWRFGGTDSGSTVYRMPTNSDSSYCNITSWTCCTNFVRFVSWATNNPTITVSASAIRTEARLRTMMVADAMRYDGIVVYAIGLGSVDSAYLYQLANDQTSSAYNPNLPAGKAAIAPTSADLDSVFRWIAADILSRLTR